MELPRVAAVLAAALALAAAAAPPAPAQTPGSVPGADPNALTVPSVTDRPPAGRRRSAREVTARALRVPKVRAARAQRRDAYARAYLKGRRHWQVSIFAPRAGSGRDEEIAQVLVEDQSGRVLEAWTGIHVAWTMARGYAGAFGRKVNAPYVWIPLLLAFLAPFARPPWRLLHLDLLVLAAFSASYAFFTAAQIAVSVPLVYPLLAYLLVRMLLLARARARGTADKPPLRLLLSSDGLALAIVFLLGFRLGLNVTASNVIDVGYAGVIGADRLVDGEELYGHFPPDNEHGDTYGPVNYYAYVPFEQALPWGGRWDDLPAAHAAALAFDFACAGLVYLLGRRLRGPRLGLLLTYLWLTFPFTLMVSNSNANDSLVAALVLGALLAAGHPISRGALVAAAGLTKFAPLALGPLLATYGRGGRGALLTVAGGAMAAGVLLAPVAGELGPLVERGVEFQADRESPFSIWGYHGLETAQRVAQAGAVGLAVAVAFVPRRRDLVALTALAAAVLIALQISVTHWFYLYLVWFVPLVLAAVLAEHEERAPA